MEPKRNMKYYSEEEVFEVRDENGHSLALMTKNQALQFAAFVCKVIAGDTEGVEKRRKFEPSMEGGNVSA